MLFACCQDRASLHSPRRSGQRLHAFSGDGLGKARYEARAQKRQRASNRRRRQCTTSSCAAGNGQPAADRGGFAARAGVAWLREIVDEASDTRKATLIPPHRWSARRCSQRQHSNSSLTGSTARYAARDTELRQGTALPAERLTHVLQLHPLPQDSFNSPSQSHCASSKPAQSSFQARPDLDRRRALSNSTHRPTKRTSCQKSLRLESHNQTSPHPALLPSHSPRPLHTHGAGICLEQTKFAHWPHSSRFPTKTAGRRVRLALAIAPVRLCLRLERSRGSRRSDQRSGRSFSIATSFPRSQIKRYNKI